MKCLLKYSPFLAVVLIIVSCQSNSNNALKNGKFGSINPSAPVETEQWGQLAGEWNCISKDLDMRNKDNEQWYSNRAIWKWEYVLGGHAVLNQWWQEDISPNPVTKEFYATGLFIFNPETNLWEAIVSNSRPHKLSPKFQAQYNDGKIEMHDGSGKWLVTFFDIQKNSFKWKYEIALGNREWKSISEISATRKL